ncbi:MAG: pseudouridine synthase [Prevotellaceae bacterium]|nr:pseudouridine synthase [Prevotellaceae bacterium]
MQKRTTYKSASHSRDDYKSDKRGRSERPSRPSYPKREGASLEKPDRPQSDKPRRSFPARDGEQRERPRRSFPPRDGEQRERPRRSFPSRDGEQRERPRRSFPARDGEQRERPRRSFPPRDGEQRERPRRSFPARDGEQPERPRRSFPPRDGEQRERPFRRRPAQEPSFSKPRRSITTEPDEQRSIKLRSRKNKQTPEPQYQDKEYRPEFLKDDMRLNKFLSNSGVCSRREADEYIAAGLVTVNGEIIMQMGSRVKPTDDVRFNGERLTGEERVYIVMNKPKDFVTTTEDPHAEQTVLDLVAGKCAQRVYPVGRLDKTTTGVLLLTNDGALTEQLTHPSHNRKKIYQVNLDKNLKKTDLEALINGIELEDGVANVDEISYIDEDESKVGVEIHSGRNRILRRMFEHLGYNVKKLDRVYFAGLTKKNLRRGAWRFLTPKEVAMLKMGAYE